MTAIFALFGGQDVPVARAVFVLVAALRALRAARGDDVVGRARPIALRDRVVRSPRFARVDVLRAQDRVFAGTHRFSNANAVLFGHHRNVFRTRRKHERLFAQLPIATG